MWYINVWGRELVLQDGQSSADNMLLLHVSMCGRASSSNAFGPVLVILELSKLRNEQETKPNSYYTFLRQTFERLPKDTKIYLIHWKLWREISLLATGGNIFFNNSNRFPRQRFESDKEQTNEYWETGCRQDVSIAMPLFSAWKGLTGIIIGILFLVLIDVLRSLCFRFFSAAIFFFFCSHTQGTT